MDYIQAFEKAIGKEAIKEFLPMQAGDVLDTYSDMTEMVRDFDYLPTTTLEEGVGKFVQWFKEYYHY
jgi:UDP-glucuronate 4-epimerase